MTMKAYANQGWLNECRDRMASIKTLAALEYEVSVMEQSRPSWVTDETIRKLNRAWHIRHDILSQKLADK